MKEEGEPPPLKRRRVSFKGQGQDQGLQEGTQEDTLPSIEEETDYTHHGISLNFVQMVAIATPKAVKLEPGEGANANPAEAGDNPDDPVAVAERCAMMHSQI
eukprot:5486319-Heterocapsa_arctica.AAC.1